MAGVDSRWQVPQSDDIDPDALEYLFISQQRERSSSPPWVEIISEPETNVRRSPELLRLQTKVEMLAGEVDLLSQRLQQANCQIGYLLSQVAERDKLLESLPEYRLTAARAASNFKSSKPNLWRMPGDLLLCVLMVAFAWLVLVTLLT